VIINGAKTKPPRYYTELYKVDNPAGHEQVAADRVAAMKKHESDNTPSRLNQRETVKKAQHKQLKRHLEEK
jgi:hypothetical protein